MTRLRRYIHNVASGQILIGVNVLFTLLSVSLALRYLSPAEFALWATLFQIAGYLALIDFGLAGSLSRLLVDEKDDRTSNDYAALVRTGLVVQMVQGAVIVLAGCLLAPGLASLMEIPVELEADFIFLVRCQAGLLGASFTTRIFVLVLRAHQRVDIVNLAQMAGFAANLGALYVGLRAGVGVDSVILGNGAAFLATAVITVTMGVRMGLVPTKRLWGRFSAHQFRRIFGFGFNIFLVTVGTQAILFSQMIVVTRSIGFEAYGIWAVASKPFTLLCQVIWRIYDMSEPALAEMMVRKERERLRFRYQTLFVFVVAVSSIGAVGLATCNGSFVALWTGGRLGWAPLNDLLLGVWLMLLTALHCHNCLIVQTKELGRMPVVYFGEGIWVLGAGLLAARWAGFTGMILVSIVGSIFFSGAFGVTRVARYFGLSVRNLLGWMLPAVKMLVSAALLAAPVWAMMPEGRPVLKLLMCGLACSAAALFLLPRFALSGATRAEIVARLPRPMKNLVCWFFDRA